METPGQNGVILRPNDYKTAEFLNYTGPNWNILDCNFM